MCHSVAPAGLSGTVSQLDRTYLHVQGRLSLCESGPPHFAEELSDVRRSGLRVTNHGIVEIYAAFRHMRGDPLRGAWCLELYLIHDECSLTGRRSSRAV
jgi:hypothetical protein